MANQYTNTLKKRMPAPGDFDWDDEWHDNEKIDDWMLGALASRNRVLLGGVASDGGGLDLDYTEVVAVIAGARVIAAAGAVAMAASELNYVYVNASGVISSSPGSPPTGEYVPLALVDTGAAAIVRIGDARVFSECVAGENIVINGDMAVDQANEGAAVSVTTADKYVVDMLLATAANHSAVVDGQRVTGFGGFNFAAKLTVTTADTLASGEHGHGFKYYIEYQDCQLIAGRYLAIKFKFQATLAGTYSAAVQSGDASNSYVTSFAYASGGVVQDISLLIPVPSAKVISGTNSRGLILSLGQAAVGTKATSSSDQWVAGDYYAKTGCLDWEVTIGNYISITGLHSGPDLLPAEFPHRPAGGELPLCQRYYCKSYSPGTVPGTAVGLGGIAEYATRNAAANSPGARFPVAMRTAPTITLYATGTGAAGNVTNNGDKAAVASSSGNNAFHGITITGGDAAYAVTYQFVADARM